MCRRRLAGVWGIAVAFVIVLAGCTHLSATTTIRTLSAAGAVAAIPPPPPGTLTFVHFNDIYEIDTRGDGSVGGLSRVKTVLDRLRGTGGPLLTTLGGDFLSPSAIGTAVVDGEPLAGRQMVDVLNAIGLDWATLGNHEFDVGEAGLLARIAQARFRIVVSNVTNAAGEPFQGTVASTVLPIRVGRRQVRIGLIGLVIATNHPSWTRFSDPIEAARREVAALSGRTDAIVALTHLTLDTDQALVAAVPEIDLVLGGHEHENWTVRRGPGLTPIVKADANVRSVAVVSMSFGEPGQRVDVSSRLQPIDARVPKEPVAEALVQDWMNTAFTAFRRSGFEPGLVIGHLTEPLDGRETTVRFREGPLTNLIMAGIAREAGAVDVVMLSSGSVRIDDVVPAGQVTEYDVIRILPFGGAVLRATVTGAILLRVVQASLENIGSGGFVHFRGLTQGSSGWLVGGAPLDPEARYRIAAPEYLLAGLEARLDFLSPANPDVRDVQWLRDIRLGLIEELRGAHP